MSASETSESFPLVVSWLVPDKVIYVAWEGVNTPIIREWMDARILALFHSCATPAVHLIFDMRKAGPLAEDSGTSPISALAHPRRGMLMRVGRPLEWRYRLFRVLYAWLFRYRYDDHFTVRSALLSLQRADPTLGDVSAYLELVP